MTTSERDLDRQAHPAPATTDRNGQRAHTPQPAPDAIHRNFGHTEPPPLPKDPNDWLPRPKRAAERNPR